MVPKSESIMESFFSESKLTTQKLYKIIVIGDPTVGKTSFVQRYVQNSFNKNYKGTVGVDFALKIVKLSETQTVRLQLWDIAGKFYFMISDEDEIIYFTGNICSISMIP